MNTVWLTARGAGLAALVLLTASTSIGALVSGSGRAATRVIVQYVHRVTAALGLGVLFVHIATVIADSYAHTGVSGALVPFTAGYRATWVGLGTIAAYAFVLVAALGFARGRMAASALGAAMWRGVHVVGYLGWALAMVHGFASGTDTAIPWVRWLYLLSGAAVAGSVAARLTGAVRPDLVRHPSVAVPR